MLSIIHLPSILTRRIQVNISSQKMGNLVVCSARGPRPRFRRVWKPRKRIDTISKSEKLVKSIKGLSNVKEEVYGALDTFIAWDLEFPLKVIKQALKTLAFQKEWKRIIQMIKWMLNKGQGQTMGTYYTLLNAFAEDGRLEEAEELWSKLLSRYLNSLPRIFFMKMISLYYTKGSNEKIFEIFADMEELAVQPDRAIVRMVGDIFQKLGMYDKYEKLHMKYPPPKWEYHYIKGKCTKVRGKQLADPGDGEDEGKVPGKRFTATGVNETRSNPVGVVPLPSPDDDDDDDDDEDEDDETAIEVEGFTASEGGSADPGDDEDERNDNETRTSTVGVALLRSLDVDDDEDDETDIEVEGFTAPESESAETVIRLDPLIDLNDNEAETAGQQIPDQDGR